MNIFRSETMQYFKIVLPKDNSLKIMSALESTGDIHFVSQTKGDGKIKGYYSESARRCELILFQLAAIEKRLEKSRVHITHPENQEDFYKILREKMERSKLNEERYFVKIEAELQKLFSRINEYSHHEANIDDNAVYLFKKVCFLRLTQQMVPPDQLP